MWDAEIEREEAEAAALREAAAAEAQQAAEEAEAEMQRQRLQAEGEEGDGEAERDLDDDIPEADDEQGSWLDEDDDGALPTQEGDGDYADTGDLGADGDLEVDLDGDVPEAGSYEHTDTGEEDSDQGEDTRMSLPRPGNVQRADLAPLGSSGFGGSPMAPTSQSRRSSGFPRRGA